MDTFFGILVLAAIIVAWWKYTAWLEQGIKPRHFTTTLAAEEVRRLFVSAVTGTGWKIVDDGNPLICQSPLLTGIRQQLGLNVQDHEQGTVVRVGPQRWVTSWGVPKKAHTLRMRLNAFEDAVRRADPSIAVTRSALSGR